MPRPSAQALPADSVPVSVPAADGVAASGAILQLLGSLLLVPGLLLPVFAGAGASGILLTADACLRELLLGHRYESLAAQAIALSTGLAALAPALLPLVAVARVGFGRAARGERRWLLGALALAATVEVLASAAANVVVLKAWRPYWPELTPFLLGRSWWYHSWSLVAYFLPAVVIVLAIGYRLSAGRVARLAQMVLSLHALLWTQWLILEGLLGRTLGGAGLGWGAPVAAAGALAVLVGSVIEGVGESARRAAGTSR
ncbi:MAG: hypothetical protein HZA54_18335 [Planctomycetes bacterium]|nr:hypothetical protein [Planctomycetota bacterium]